MKLFKNPLIALLLAVIIVISSTTASILEEIELGFDELLDAFYYGDESRKDMKGLHVLLLELCHLSDAVSIFAEDCGIDNSELVSAKSGLENELRRETPDIDDIYDKYIILCSCHEAFHTSLSTAGLSADMNRKAAEFIGSYETITSQINASSYNSLRTAYSEKLGPIEKFVIELFDLDIPGYFI